MNSFEYIKTLFTEHPHSVNETYVEHMFCACKFGIKLLYYSIVVLIHSVFPFLFKTTASDGIIKLSECMKGRRK